MAKRGKLPTDANQRGRAVVDLATGAADAPDGAEQPHRGQAGGLRGGRARAERLSPEERSEIARKAAKARWKRQSGEATPGS